MPTVRVTHEQLGANKPLSQQQRDEHTYREISLQKTSHESERIALPYTYFENGNEYQVVPYHHANKPIKLHHVLHHVLMRADPLGTIFPNNVRT